MEGFPATEDEEESWKGLRTERNERAEAVGSAFVGTHIVARFEQAISFSLLRLLLGLSDNPSVCVEIGVSE